MAILSSRTSARSPFERLVIVLSLACLSLLVLVAHSSWGRPIWWDEFIYFALGGLPTFADALQATYATTPNLNQGATGAYMIADFLLLKTFGAQLWALRLPSLLSGTWMILSGFVFLRFRGASAWGLAAWPLMLMGQQTLLYYVGEARPYMPLAAAVTGSLAYYALPSSHRRLWWARGLGWGSMILGSIFHPYFLLYFITVLTISWYFIGENKIPTDGSKSRLRALIRFGNPPLLVSGLTLYAVVGSLSWFRGTATRVDLNPFLFLEDPLWKAVLAQLFQFSYVNRLSVILSLGILIGLTINLAYRQGLSRCLQLILGPTMLIGAAIVLAFFISAASIMSGFWVIPRQWIASIAIASLGILWLVRILISGVGIPVWRDVVASALFLILVGGAVGPMIKAFETSFPQHEAAATPREPIALLKASRMQGFFPEENAWVDAANANVAVGGSVDRVFGDFYTSRDWTVFRLED